MIRLTSASALAVALTIGWVGTAQAQVTWRFATPDFPWEFPRDHWSHSGFKTEWWYFTGILTADGDTTRQFGYQFTFFRIGIAPTRPPLASGWAVRDLIMGHAAITDLSTGEHRFSELLYRTAPVLGQFGEPGDSLIAWSVGPPGTDARWSLVWNGSAFDVTARDDRNGLGFSLSTHPSKPLVFQGPNGFSRKGERPSAASLYYSFPRLVTSGMVRMGSESISVSGESWMDKEFGSNQLAEHQVGWDWFALRLNDQRDLMVYVLRGGDGKDYALATLISPDGTPSYLDDSMWTLQTTDRWRSDETKAEYPAGWELHIPGANIALEITPLVRAQENVSQLIPDLFYWEGAVTVRDPAGDVVGEGYVELTGYGTNSRPAI